MHSTKTDLVRQRGKKIKFYSVPHAWRSQAITKSWGSYKEDFFIPSHPSGPTLLAIKWSLKSSWNLTGAKKGQKAGSTQGYGLLVCWRKPVEHSIRYWAILDYDMMNTRSKNRKKNRDILGDKNRSSSLDLHKRNCKSEWNICFSSSVHSQI